MNILDLIFPRRCVSCGKIGEYFCQKCAAKIEFTAYKICPVCGRHAIDGVTHPRCQTRYTLDGLTSFFLYDGIIRKAIKAIKYRFVSDLAKELIDLIPQNSFSRLTMYQSNNLTMLLPIPLYPSRLRFRGFNQAEVLGRILSERLDIPMRTDILKRIRKTVPQVEVKDRKKRLLNMENVFAANQSAIQQCDNVTILLFDDVFTTGATLRTAANILKRTGVKKVWGIVLAHG